MNKLGKLEVNTLYNYFLVTRMYIFFKTKTSLSISTKYLATINFLRK